jgi:uncharacterized protein Yka (UPF0111/DUF47 family)
MATHAELAAKLLRGAAKFFRALSEGNPDIREQMLRNADTYEQVADMVERDPTGTLPLEGDSP